MKITHTLLSSAALIFIGSQSLVAQASVEKVPAEKEAEQKLDFGDFSSQTLTTNAWASLAAKDHKAVEGFVGKCIEMFEKQAVEMQGKLKAAPTKETANEFWALNDVCTCYFIRAQSKEAKGDTKGALADYKVVVEKLSFGQCWDVKGWFWKPSDAAKGKIKELEFDSAE